MTDNQQKDLEDIHIRQRLREKFFQQDLHRPLRVKRYDVGERLAIDCESLSADDYGKKAIINFEIEKFAGGGFAGQVYKAKVMEIAFKENEPGNPPLHFPIRVGHSYAIKILIPPSGFSIFFRNLLYRVGFQGAFQPQVNPTAARAGALWQKLIRRGAKTRFGDESVVNDIHATFVDTKLGSCGEISDWIDGRTWRLEVDDRMDLLKLHNRGKKVKTDLMGSPEYRAKKKYMADFVQLLHDMGAHEFARQYEWSTAKSQPNCLKRNETEKDPTQGLTAVDFRAGLALLPLLPMSPGDFKLILKGIGRGSLVQFDRGNLKKLDRFIQSNKDEFPDMLPLFEDLKTCEKIYRDSIPDITHNHFRLLFSRRLWSTMLSSLRKGWRVQNLLDDHSEQELNKNAFLTIVYYVLGIIPFLGRFFRKTWGRPDWRRHYAGVLSKWGYLKRAFRGKMAEKAIDWNRNERVTAVKAGNISDSFGLYLLHLPLSILPGGVHRFFTDGQYARERLHNIFVRPFKLYFSAPFREEWLKDMIEQGEKKHILARKDADTIRGQLKEPFIQKYLKSLAVHVCTLPVTQIVSVTLSWIYVRAHPQLTNAEAMAAVAAILILFQVTPISPGSLVRGLYVVYMVIKDRNFKDYNIAVFLGFFKYIGYLAFPIQMTYRYPELARFMAGHWATEGVHIVPVFGESGALLEHWVFRLFYNWPLTIRRRMIKQMEIRTSQKPRYWHTVLYIAAAVAILGTADLFYLKWSGIVPTLGDTWWLVLIVIFLCGVGIVKGCGGAPLSGRIISAVTWGIAASILYTAFSVLFIWGEEATIGNILINGGWRLFLFSFLAPVGAAIRELRLKDPDLKSAIQLS